MKTPAILSLGTATPQYSLSQVEISERVSQLMHLDDEASWVLEKIFKNSAISKRYSVLPDILVAKKGMTERNGIYKKEAPALAEQAARVALEGYPLDKITHVISVSCTGAITPGLEFIVADRLGLDPYVSLLGINFMGCHGAFKGLKMAHKIACENPNNRVLLICTELCSLHFKPQGDIESIVIQSLFADGAAAAVIGQEKGLFEIVKEQSYSIRGSMQEMTWNASSDGFDMTLSEKVPGIIGEYIQPFVKKMVGERCFSDFHWAIHPGGKAIIETVEKTLSLEKTKTDSSWKVLNEWGNLSSATFLYVLNDLKNQKDKSIVGLGFGPGLSVEGVLLQC